MESAFNLPDVKLVISTYRKDYLVGAVLCIAATMIWV
jgi:hypothetical protein